MVILPRARRCLAWLSLSAAAVIAAGGYWQAAVSEVFWCGRTEAFPGTAVLAILCLAQSALYLAASMTPAARPAYRLSQLAVLPFLLLGLWQVFAPHPHTALLFAGLGATGAAAAGFATGPTGMQARLSRAALFGAAALGFLAAIGQVPFTLPGVTVPDRLLAAALLAAAAAAALVVASARLAVPAARLLPLSLLLFPVLRAKLPDIAYDSLAYKVTIPYQLAEWRTGDTAVIDGYMTGTNLQDILNGLLVALTGDYSPSLVSTAAFVLLAGIAPLAFPGRGLVPAFAALCAFTLTEASIAQGTAYHEPLLLLFLVAALIRCPAWPAFLAMAVAVKINAAFIAPLIAFHHLRHRAAWPGLLAGVLAGCLALGPQLNRNVIYSGRLLGMQETLAAVTDPPGAHQVMAAGATRYDARPRGGIVNNAVQSACNMWLLNELCPVRYEGTTEAGFNVFPASRAPLFALVLAAGILATGRWAGIASVAAYAIGYIGFLAFLAEDRFFLPLSLGFSVLLLANRRTVARAVRTTGRWPAVALGCLLAGSDLIPGTFTNTSWICKREVATAADTTELRGPRTPVQSFLADYVAQYERTCPPPGLPPVILAENDRMNSPYLGTQRIFHVFSQPMIMRFFAANPARQPAAADAILAVVAETEGYPATVLGPALADYAPCFAADGLHVLCSQHLAPEAQRCARSLY